MASQHTQACAAIQNEASAAWSRQLQARRIAAIAPGRLIHRGSGSANAPESNLCGGLAQRCPVAWRMSSDVRSGMRRLANT